MAKVPILKLLNYDSFQKRQTLIENGMPVSVVETLLKERVLVREDLQKIIPTRTWARRRLEGVLNQSETDSLLRLAELFDRAVDTFADVDKAISWLRSPCRALGGKVPIEIAYLSSGAAEVERELGRIAYGLPS
ncbi:MAG: DUF2384 domain-containing protein [Candidatus Melainabacteria bacterium]|nr:DUF2384 domain-containing protein [Candidatus Melainabacteria bacterium]